MNPKTPRNTPIKKPHRKKRNDILLQQVRRLAAHPEACRAIGGSVLRAAAGTRSEADESFYITRPHQVKNLRLNSLFHHSLSINGEATEETDNKRYHKHNCESYHQVHISQIAGETA